MLSMGRNPDEMRALPKRQCFHLIILIAASQRLVQLFGGQVRAHAGDANAIQESTGTDMRVRAAGQQHGGHCARQCRAEG
ncbi:hypothetical protein BRAO375_1030019 [Bradyrhizobium sp. ORS 375]|nr:hypothetical protein BRAO375_1030019 [Bradyrhizobium sp. ORS 375]